MKIKRESKPFSIDFMTVSEAVGTIYNQAKPIESKYNASRGDILVETQGDCSIILTLESEENSAEKEIRIKRDLVGFETKKEKVIDSLEALGYKVIPPQLDKPSTA